MAEQSKKALLRVIEWLAKKTVARFKPVVIGVTGSVGKTSTVEAIATVLANKRRIRASHTDFSGEYAIPLAVLGAWPEEDLQLVDPWTASGLSSGKRTRFLLRVIIVSFFKYICGIKKMYPEVLVFEYASQKPGDLAAQLDIVRPNISVVTAVGDAPAHVESYVSAEAVAKEKARLVESLPASGLAVLCGDELRVSVMAQKTRATALTFGFAESCDVRIIDFENKIESRDGLLKPIGITFKLGYDGAFVPVRISGSLGSPASYAAAAAACVGLAFNLNLVDVSQALAYYKPPASRMQFLRGIHNSVLIDDSYDASPLSMRMAIETVKEIKAKRTIAVLGDMRELGEFSLPAHKEIAAFAAKIFDVIVAVGPQATQFAEAAVKARIPKKNIFYVIHVEDALTQLPGLIQAGDVVLIKGDRAMQLEKAVQALTPKI